MRAFILDSFDTPARLRDDVPEPHAADAELLVRVHASSVNPVDAFIAAGYLEQYAEYEFPVTLGRDFAGVVEQTGGGVGDYNVGDEVYGFVPSNDPAVHDGSWAELITAPEDNQVAAKPRSLDMAHAGAAPLVGITALAAFDALAPGRDETVLVIGATGGVGSFFVQLAAAAGANVIAPGFPDDEDYLRGLGVNEILDRDADLEATVRERHADGVDAILDVVSDSPQESLLKDIGRLASSRGTAGEGAQRFNLMAQPTPENLRRLARLLDDGSLRVLIEESFELARAGDALAALGNHTRGKVALSIA
jgi:NADPH:quinone reductase-like Zn-dependent oxidoreductase